MARKPTKTADAPVAWGGAINANLNEIEAAISAPATVEQPVSPNAVTNCLPGTVLHLESGARLAFGESAEVSASEAAFLRDRGQVK